MRFVTKDFLSQSPDESGSVIVSINTQQFSKLTEYSNAVRNNGVISATVRIADCSDHVVLDFHAEGQKNFEKRCQKLDFLIEKLQAMRKQYGEMWESHLRDIAHFKKQEGIKDEA